MNIPEEIRNPYFDPSKDGAHLYLAGALESIEILNPHLSTRKRDSLKNEKLQLFKGNINEVQYLQAACELTICAYFAKHFPSKFKYEPQPFPPKDIDCSYEDGGYLINIEVKCADFSKKNDIDQQDAFKMSALGRVPGFEKIIKDLEPVMTSGSLGKPLVVQPHMDNKLKDFLLSAHSKFSEAPSPTTLNVLAVCCDNPHDIQKWFYYMYGSQGLFRQDSYVQQSEYNRVDAVFLTSLYHRHHEYFNKDKIKNHWDLASSFNLVCSNPFRKLDKEKLFYHFAKTVPNYSTELSSYRVPGSAPDDVKDALRISSFIHEKLHSAGYFHFLPVNEASD